jgi:hypothetical protein
MVKKITLILCSVLMLNSAWAQSVAVCGTMINGTLFTAPCPDDLSMCPKGYSLRHAWNGSTFVQSCEVSNLAPR